MSDGIPRALELAVDTLKAAAERIAHLEIHLAAAQREIEELKRNIQSRCSDCGAILASYPHGCPDCGAPVCCPQCCKLTLPRLKSWDSQACA